MFTLEDADGGSGASIAPLGLGLTGLRYPLLKQWASVFWPLRGREHGMPCPYVFLRGLPSKANCPTVKGMESRLHFAADLV